MAALTGPRTETRERDGKTRHTLVAANTKIHAGGMVAKNAAGFAVPVTAAANLVGLGRAEESIDNTGGAAGAQSVRSTRGTFNYANSAGADELTHADIGSLVYGVDDQTVAKTDDGGKPMAGRLLFVPRGEAKSASGKAMPSVALGPTDLKNYRATQADRGKYGAVVAQWHNPATGQPESLKVGGGGEGPTHTIRQKYPDADQAQRAASAKMDALARGVGTFSGDVVPGRPSLGAEGKMVVSGLGDIASGTWVITRAVHKLDKSGGLTTSVEGETPKGETAA